jgi:hypothetical protein
MYMVYAHKFRSKGAVQLTFIKLVYFEMNTWEKSCW